VIITGGGGGGVYACDDANDGKWYWFFCGVLPIGEKNARFSIGFIHEKWHHSRLRPFLNEMSVDAETRQDDIFNLGNETIQVSQRRDAPWVNITSASARGRRQSATPPKFCIF